MPVEAARGHEMLAEDTEHSKSLRDNDRALVALQQGNTRYAQSTSSQDDPQSSPAMSTPMQTPFVAALGCSDARVPLEMIFDCGQNQMFTVRVAGNVTGSDVRGSLNYATQHLPSIQVLAVVGHSDCGAVTTAVDVTLRPSTYEGILYDAPLRGIVDAILPAVHIAESILAEVYGSHARSLPSYRDALIRTATVANTILSSTALTESLGRDVYFGVYDIRTRIVGLLGEGADTQLLPPVSDGKSLETVLRKVARGCAIGAVLEKDAE